MANNYDQLPAALEPFKIKKIWAVYRLVQKPDGKTSKPPYNPLTGTGAKNNDPGTWATYSDALNAYKASNGFYAGVGIMLGNGIMGVDLDHVVDITGRAVGSAQTVVDMMDSYTEYSQSGTGLHILAFGSKPDRERSKCPLSGSTDGAEIEMYDSVRFLTLTGNVYQTERAIAERSEAAAAVYRKYINPNAVQTAVEPPRSPVEAMNPQRGTNTSRSDEDVLLRAFSSQKGNEIRALYFGDMSQQDNDHSRADLALMNHLAFWTNGNAEQMDRLFRRSSLMRDKWDRKQSGTTYGQLTIAEALKGFTPWTPTGRTAAEDFSGVGADPGSSSAPVTVPAAAQATATPGAAAVFRNGAPSDDHPHPDGIDTYLTEALTSDIADFQKYASRKTGFPILDKTIGGLYPGLYVLGAISSLGKTTFIHQMADNLASAGYHVLFFSLEQSRLEMALKSVSRMTAQLDHGNAVSAISIREGYRNKLVQDAIDEYSLSVGSRMSVIEGNFALTVEDIGEYVRQYIRVNGVKPVVVIDYLQILQTRMDTRGDTKTRIDDAVKYLKQMQVENQLLVFVVSSVNRANYTAPVDFESFKESGNIEYTADVVWGLQLYVLNAPMFESDNKVLKKREVVKKAKNEVPRLIELVCLKNRYGRSSYSDGFMYDPRYDYFMERDIEEMKRTITFEK